MSGENMEINVCFASDDNYAQHLAVAVASMLLNASKDDFINCFIIDDGISVENKTKIAEISKVSPCKITYVKINPDDFEGCYLPEGMHFTMATFYRLKAASLFADIDKIIYLDSDMIIQGSLAPLFGKDLTDYYVAGARDIFALDDNSIYINAGMSMFNLVKIRQDKVEEALLNYVRNNATTCPDQDAINVVCKGKILPVELKWNNQCMKVYQTTDPSLKTKKTEQTQILHFIGKCKPWQHKGHYEQKVVYYHYLNKTPFATFKTKYLQWIENIITAAFCSYEEGDHYKYRIFTFKGKIKKRK